MAMNEDQEAQPTRPAENIRASLRQYPAKKTNIFLYCFQAYAITLEVFIHREFGEQYLSWLKCFVGFVFLYFLAVVTPPYHLEHNTPTFPLHLVSWLPIDIPIPLVQAKRVSGLNIIPVFLIICYAFAQSRLAEIFLFNRFNSPPHPKSSGEPYFLWDSAYELFERLNFRIDLVKQACEPALCFFAGLVALAVSFASTERGLIPETLFIAAWLMSASVALFIKAYFENRSRKSLYLDRIGGDMNLEAMRLQQRLSHPTSAAVTFSEVK